ncbi:MAG: lyase family protein [Pseudomonadota bacterium]
MSATSFLTRPIFGHPETAKLFSDRAFAAAMVDVEVALAEGQAELGLIPVAAAVEIAGLRARTLDLDLLEAGVRSTGVPVPALVDALRAMLTPSAADWLHYGATSQDIVDTALVLSIRQALDALEGQLGILIDRLEALSQAHRATLMVARTRGQLATPITFGLRAAQWALPLIKLEADVPRVRAAALCVQFGGASGSRSTTGAETAAAMAARLGLPPAPPWHTDRSGLRRLSGWLELKIHALAKLGGDVALSQRGEVGELRTTGGGSSTMPHKSNPVRAEALQALAALATACTAGLSISAVHIEERDGAMWSVEWLLLPTLIETAAAAVDHALLVLADLSVDTAAMAARIESAPAALSEATVFALSPKLGRQEATRHVKDCLKRGEDLSSLLTEHLGADGEAAVSPKSYIEPAAAVADEVFALRRRQRP